MKIARTFQDSKKLVGVPKTSTIAKQCASDWTELTNKSAIAKIFSSKSCNHKPYAVSICNFSCFLSIQILMAAEEMVIVFLFFLCIEFFATVRVGLFVCLFVFLWLFNLSMAFAALLHFDRRFLHNCRKEKPSLKMAKKITKTKYSNLYNLPFFVHFLILSLTLSILFVIFSLLFLCMVYFSESNFIDVWLCETWSHTARW